MKTTIEEFDTMVTTIYPRVFSFALKLTRNPEDASDVTQETFVRAYKARDRRLLDRNADSWLFRIAYRCFLDGRRKAGRRLVSVSTEVLSSDNFKFDPADTSDNPEQKFFRNKLSGPMSRALESLSHEQRTLMQLYHSDDLTHNELSRIFGCGATTIKTRIHRVHVAIKLHLSSVGLDSAGACRRSADAF